MNTIAIIPARAGSTRLPNKNVADFLGEPLLVRKIKQLIGAVDRIYVWSDSNEYLDLAQTAGAVPLHREGEWADEKTHSFGERVAHVCGLVEGETVLWSPCTSPLVTGSHYQAALELYQSVRHHGYDSLMSVQPFKRYVWDEHGAVNYHADKGHVRSQDLKEYYFACDAIQIAPRLSMIGWQYFIGKRPFLFQLDKRSAVDVDDSLDMACAKAWSEMA
jgi:N-acylneuraminate cytidylyltransferase